MSTGRRVEARPGRFRSWRSGWRLALRMARRDVVRDRLRSVFVWAMIAIPVATICAGHVVIASDDLSREERLELRLAGAQAALTRLEYGFKPDFDGVGTAQGRGDGNEGTWPAAGIPGWGEAIAQQQDAVAALAGRPALAVTLSDPSRTNGVTLLNLGVDTTRPEAAGLVRATTGRLPAAPNEALVTPAGLAAGLPAAGALSLVGADGSPRELVVVGVGEAKLDAVPDLVTAPDPASETRYFLLTGDLPVTWDDAVRFAGYGLETASRQIAASPPDWATPDFGDEESARFFASALISSGALLEVVLVVGPAFAIGAARQRRSLALAASNGAGVAQLRRAALGQAILLGVSAAVVGAVVGTAAGIAVWPLLRADPVDFHGPLEVPVPQLAMALGLGVVSALTAAMVAARGLGRLDVVSALRGSVRSGAPRKGAPLAGGLLVVAGLAVCWSVGSLFEFDSVWVFVLWCSGAFAVVGGALLLVPVVLLLLARTVGGGPMALRMAVRETSRQRGRATSTVAAITAGGVVLGVVWTIIGSIDADSARTYHPDAPAGQAWIQGWEADTPASLAGAESVVAGIDASLVTARTSDVTGWSTDGAAEARGALAALKPGCLPADLQIDVAAECYALRTDWSGRRFGIMAGPATELARSFGLDASQESALREGKLLVDTGGTGEAQPDWDSAVTPIVDGSVSFVRFEDSDPAAEPGLETVPALAVPSEVISRGASLDRTGALISSEAAAERGWVMSDWALRLAAPGGAIAPALEARLAEALKPIGFSIGIERGWQPRPQPIVWAITGTLALLAVVAAAMATVLGIAELRPFLGTLAAVGAGPGLSRRVAATQSWLLGFMGSALGAGVGVAVGAPLARAATGHENTMTPVLAVPWTLMSALVVAVPLVACLVAVVCVPSRPVLVRRAT